MLGALGQLAVGLIHMANLFESLEKICNEDSDFITCIGGMKFQWNYPCTVSYVENGNI